MDCPNCGCGLNITIEEADASISTWNGWRWICEGCGKHNKIEHKQCTCGHRPIGPGVKDVDYTTALDKKALLVRCGGCDGMDDV